MPDSTSRKILTICSSVYLFPFTSGSSFVGHPTLRILSLQVVQLPGSTLRGVAPKTLGGNVLGWLLEPAGVEPTRILNFVHSL